MCVLMDRYQMIIQPMNTRGERERKETNDRSVVERLMSKTALLV